MLTLPLVDALGSGMLEFGVLEFGVLFASRSALLPGRVLSAMPHEASMPLTGLPLTVTPISRSLATWPA